jgi:hypothetical protein
MLFGYEPELPALQALVKTTALIMLGTTLMPARVAAMTNGEAEASPARFDSSLSLDGTINEMTKIDITVYIYEPCMQDLPAGKFTNHKIS